MNREPPSELSVYGVPQLVKRELLLEDLRRLTQKHVDSCKEYKAILDARGWGASEARSLEDLPFLPVGLFKTETLKSVPVADIVKTLTSSGTTGQAVSRIYLDKETAMMQSRALIKIMQNFIGKERLPMLIVDHPGIVKDRNSFSARGAGILGMANFGRDHCYALRDEDMSLDEGKLEDFLRRNRGGKVLIFGFTFMVWKYFVKPILDGGMDVALDNAVLVHSGGWKKLEDEAVDNATFKRFAFEAAGISRVHNFYGMVEQVGSVFVECSEGYLHAPIHADVIIRSPRDWSALNVGESGLIQVISTLPHSYPGHSLLTEDRGMVVGEDDCRCGLKGRYFLVLGRLPRAEARGCSDTFEAKRKG
ncbi:MAG: acyl-protein synthetase [Clostridia bacterium]|nr:hypothetical protein [Caulobacteraceae bacterium]MBQ8109211.1 acyl-protein synthetase [Clostridia bacterium]